MALGKFRCMHCGGNHKTDDCASMASSVVARKDLVKSLKEAVLSPAEKTREDRVKALQEAVSVAFGTYPPEYIAKALAFYEDHLKRSREAMKKYRAKKGEKL